MHKKILLIGLLTCMPLKAMEIEGGIGYNQVNIDWIADSTFNVNMLTLESTLWQDLGIAEIGLRAQLGMSNSSSNTGNTTHYKESMTKLESFSSVQVALRTKLTNKLYMDVSGGLMDYNQSVTNFYEDGYENTDSGYMFSLGLTQYITNDVSLRVSYSKYHEKTKTQEESPHNLYGDGKESTSSIGITLNYQF